MVQVYDVQEKANQYLLDTGRKPKYLLFDSATYRSFSQSFRPKEKISFLVDDEPEHFEGLLSLWLNGDIQLQILEVNTKESFFEVAG